MYAQHALIGTGIWMNIVIDEPRGKYMSKTITKTT